MKKILFVATETMFINLFNLPYLDMFKKNGWEIHVATGDDLEVERNCDKKINIGINRSPFSLKNFSATKYLKKVINDEQYDKIHCHTPMGSIVARFSNFLSNKKAEIIYTAHGFHFFKGSSIISWAIYYPIEKIMSKITDKIITINEEDYLLAKRKFKNKKNEIYYVPGVGIDFKKFNENYSKEEIIKLKEEFSIPNDTFILTFVGRLDDNKNQIELIEITKMLHNYGYITHLVLAGRDELEGKLQQMSEKLLLKQFIHFLGNRNDIPKILQMTDLYVSTSLREGLPVNIIEAICSNKFVIAYNCRGMSDIIEDGENGLLVEIKNKDLMKDYIIEYINNSNKVNKHTGGIEKFDINNVMNMMIKIYNL